MADNWELPEQLPPPAGLGGNKLAEYIDLAMNIRNISNPYFNKTFGSGELGIKPFGNHGARIGIQGNYNPFEKRITATGGNMHIPVTDNLSLDAMYNRYGGKGPGSKLWNIQATYRF